jgi:hypothetical protein
MSSKPFDVSLKELIGNDPMGWAEYLFTEPILGASFIEAETSTVSAQADKVIRIELASGPVLLNLEPQSSYDAQLPQRMHLYSTLLTHRHGLSVHSVALLLRPQANTSSLTGIYERQHPLNAAPIYALNMTFCESGSSHWSDFFMALCPWLP